VVSYFYSVIRIEVAVYFFKVIAALAWSNLSVTSIGVKPELINKLACEWRKS